MEGSIPLEAEPSPLDVSKNLLAEKHALQKLLYGADRKAVRWLGIAFVYHILIPTPFVVAKILSIAPFLAPILGGPQGVILMLFVLTMIPLILSLQHMSKKQEYASKVMEIEEKIRLLSLEVEKKVTT